MPEAESGFFDESILYSHFRIVLNISTVFVGLFYYNSTIMESVYNFTFVPRYLSDKYLFSKTYFKRDNRFNLDLPKNSNFHFLTKKLISKKSISSKNIRKLSRFRRRMKISLKRTSVCPLREREKLMQYLSIESYPKMTLRFWNR